jgi:hypothetical protein
MADIQLSPELFHDIQQAVHKQHPDADNGVILQYLAAVSGYLLGSETGLDKDSKDAFFGELCGFAEQVYHDLHNRQEQLKAQPQQPVGQAFGYWTPPQQ